MAKAYSLVGQRFGRLVVQRPGPTGPLGGMAWLTLCDCGGERMVKHSDLTCGLARTCGCYRRSSVPADSLVGQRFGRLVVQGPGPKSTTGKTQLLARCDCGGERAVTPSNLRSGNTRSCGCARRVGHDFTGQRLGRLVVLGLGPRDPGGREQWIARCDCGNETLISRSRMSESKNQGCGCTRSKAADHTGKRFGKLVAKFMMPADDRGQGRRWLCQCDCGRTTIARAKDLRDTGNTTSCGCSANRFKVTRGGELSPRHIEMLRQLNQNDGAMLQATMRKALGISESSMCRNVKRMVDRGFVLSTPMPVSTGAGQGRPVLLTTTRKGRTLLSVIGLAADPATAPGAAPGPFPQLGAVQERRAA